MSGETIATVITAVTGVLGGVVAVVRALIQLLRSVERVTTIAEGVARQLGEHVQNHDAADVALADKVHSHETQLAVLHATLTAPAAGGTVSTAN